ncbi:MAG: hypothetical protein KDJ47_14675 [Hyphomicrobiaceae bacterium]|nr:hypothetical protein [Hyphomicrobiaceae bacterium]
MNEQQDIVIALRRLAQIHDAYFYDAAADEIQRLRAENDRMRKALEAIKSAESKGQAKRIAIQATGESE